MHKYKTIKAILAFCFITTTMQTSTAQFFAQDIKAQNNILGEITKISTENKKQQNNKISEIENKIKEFALKQKRTQEIKKQAEEKIKKAKHILAIQNEANPNAYQPPKTYTQELNDKRLKNLPEKTNNNFSQKEIIALRYHALMLLQNKKCKGVLDGGRSLSIKGWLYVVCTDEPNNLRQFPVDVFDSAKIDTLAKHHQG